MVPKSLRPLLPYLKKYRGAYAVGALCVLLMNGIWVLFPQIIQFTIDDLSSKPVRHKYLAEALHWIGVELVPGITRHKLLIYALVLVGIALAKSLFQFLTRWILIGISRDIEFDLRNDLFAHLEKLSYTFYQRTRTGDIMARATNDLNAVRMLLGPAIMYSANTVVFTIAALAFMLHISPSLTLYAFLPLPIASIAIQYFGRQIHERFEKIQAMFSDISARAQENFSGARVVRAYVQEDVEIASFEAANQEYIARSLKLVRLMGMLWPTLETMVGMAIPLVLWVGGRQVIDGRITAGAFVAFLTYIAQLTWPVIALGWVINIFQRGTASMGRINQLLKEEPDIRNGEVAMLRRNQPVSIRGEIEIRNLNFAYNGTEVLHEVNLRIPQGSSLAIVGPTGSGKTTLVSLIPRIYDAPAGSVLIDGQAVSDYSLQSLRRAIGFVPQETFLFSDSIRENIAYGTDGSTDQQVREAAEGANIAADIESFPEKYATIVGERGITLSGGQKQRTAIARAMIRDPKILILDDALSSVDTHTEDKILNHLREIMRGRTTIFISHRVSTVRNADQIAVLHGGRIVETGNHEELLARNGYYTDLYNKQLLEEELAEV